MDTELIAISNYQQGKKDILERKIYITSETFPCHKCRSSIWRKDVLCCLVEPSVKNDSITVGGLLNLGGCTKCSYFKKR